MAQLRVAVKRMIEVVEDELGGPGEADASRADLLSTEPLRDAAAEATDARTFAEACRIAEALLFASAEPLSAEAIASRVPGSVAAMPVIRTLQREYAARGVNLVELAGKWAFRTAEDLGYLLSQESVEPRKLSRAALETLSIIAYHQPVTRAEIEQVRGVGLSKGTLDLLFEQNWIKPMGRRRAPGKPVTWGTTDFFLEHFGLSSLDDLPGQEELKAAGLLDARSQPPIFRPEEPDLPLEPTDDETDEPLAVEEVVKETSGEPGR
jgi:segregation and condensation protein B